MLEELIAKVLECHQAKPPRPPAERELALSQIPFVVPEDVRVFFTRCNGAVLFDPHYSSYRLVGVEGFHAVRFDIFGHDEDAFGPPQLFTICDVQDGNFVALDLGNGDPKKCPVVDCFHETFGDPGYQPKVIADCFADFLHQALNSGNKLYWL